MNRKYFFVWIMALLLINGATGFGQTIPFGFFRTMGQLLYDYIGARAIPTTSFITNGAFANSNLDGAFNSQRSIALDPANDRMYVADMSNYRVQKLILSTGVSVGAIGNSSAQGTCSAGAQAAWCTGGSFSTGNGDGMFAAVMGIAIDAANDRMYVTDNARIQKFVLSTGAFLGAIGNSTASGSCQAGAQTAWCTGGVFSLSAVDGGFNSAAGIVIDVANDRMYISESGSHRVQKFVLSTGAFVGAIGNSTASGTCVAGKQTAWCSGGVFSAGSIDGAFNQPSGMALDVPNNRLIVVDGSNSRIQKFVLSTGAFSGAIGKSIAAGTCLAGKQNSWCTGGTFSLGFTDGQFWSPQGVALDLANDFMFVADMVNNRIQKFRLSTGAFLGAIGKSTASGTCIAGKQNGWCTGGSFLSSAGSTDGVFMVPMTLATDTLNNRLIVSDLGNHRLQKFVLSTGAFVGAAGGKLTAVGSWSKASVVGPPSAVSSDGGFNTARSSYVDATNDRLYVADNYRVQKFVLSTGAFIGAIGNSTASGTCIAGKQNAWCTGGNFNFGTGDGQFLVGAYLFGDSLNDRLYVLDTNRIQKFVLSTGAFLGAIGKSTASGTCLAGKQNNWCTGGVFGTGSGDGMFNQPSSMAIDHANGFFYVTDISNYRIQKFVLSTGAFVGAIGNSTASGTCALGAQPTWCTNGVFSSASGDGMFSNVTGVVIDTASDFLYVGNNNSIQKFTLSSGAFLGAIGRSSASGTCVEGSQSSWCSGGIFSSGGLDGQFNGIRSLAIDSAKNVLYVAEASRIQKLTLSTGAPIGSIGGATGGNCLIGAQPRWCFGGTFTGGTDDGKFISLYGISFSLGKLYTTETSRVQRINLGIL